MATQLTPEQLEIYRHTARQREEQRKANDTARLARAWDVARQAAALLKQTYGVQRVVAFGSLLQPDRFNQWSDVDLAAWGLTTGNWLKAMHATATLPNAKDIEVNLVDVETCSQELLTVIERDGVEL
jgi:predicted nucleotidyltransferase